MVIERSNLYYSGFTPSYLVESELNITSSCLPSVMSPTVHGKYHSVAKEHIYTPNIWLNFQYGVKIWISSHQSCEMALGTWEQVLIWVVRTKFSLASHFAYIWFTKMWAQEQQKPLLSSLPGVLNVLWTICYQQKSGWVQLTVLCELPWHLSS